MRGRKGFTLVELLVVIIVVAVTASIAIPRFKNQTRSGTESRLRADLRIIRDAIDRFKADNGYYPLSIEDLTMPAATKPVQGYDGTATVRSLAANSYQGPYLREIPECPLTQQDFAYETTAPNVGQVHASVCRTAINGTCMGEW